MLAALFYGKGDVRIEDIAEPVVRPGTVKIAPAYNGICGSDLHLYHHGPIPPAPTDQDAHPLTGETLPVVLGHEFSGVVEEVGEGVVGVSVGDHVVVEPMIVDGTCLACRAGTYNLCAQLGFIGISGGGGGLSEHVVVESRWVHGIGDIPLDQAALIEPLAVVVHSLAHAGGAQAGQVAVIGGAGPIGLLCAALLHAKGVTTIVSEVSPVRRDTARRTGVADVVVDPTGDDLATVVREHSGGAGAHLAFDAAGVAVVVDQLLDALAPGGRLEVIAVHAEPVSLDITGKLTMADRVIGSSLGYADSHAEAIDLVRSGAVDLAPFITSVIGVDELIEKGYNRLSDPAGGEVKVLVTMR